VRFLQIVDGSPALECLPEAGPVVAYYGKATTAIQPRCYIYKVANFGIVQWWKSAGGGWAKQAMRRHNQVNQVNQVNHNSNNRQTTDKQQTNNNNNNNKAIPIRKK
jgi:hypothetical protein